MKQRFSILPVRYPEEVNKMNLDKVRNTLEARLRELNERVEEIDEDLSEHEEDDSEDRATEIAGDEVLEELGSAGLREMQQIRSALKRLDKGTYGTCTRCGKKIADRRLRAVPEAALCIDCAV